MKVSINLQALCFLFLSLFLTPAPLRGSPNESLLTAAFLHEFGAQERSMRRAIEDYEIAASSGNTTAKGILSMIYASGEGGVSIDHATAVELATAAVAEDCPFGHYCLGIAYQYGRGVTRNEDRSASHYRSAAGQLPRWVHKGNPRAQHALGILRVHTKPQGDRRAKDGGS